MQIISFQFDESGENGWHFQKVALGNLNLIVGDTGTGKTRFLNTLFNLGAFVAGSKRGIKNGFWNIELRQNDSKYQWQFEIKDFQEEGSKITKDILTETKSNGEIVNIVKRDAESFIFLNNKLPKMPRDQSSITLLKEEKIIEPLYDGFSSIMRRRFFQDALQKSVAYQAVPNIFLTKSPKKFKLDELYANDFCTSTNLYLLQKYFPDKYNGIVQQIKTIFSSFVKDCAVLDLYKLHKEFNIPGKVPVFCIKEKGIDKWLELGELSSGMQKVILILTDIFVIPEGGIYIIDEYENSLGMNSIDFFPDFLNTMIKDIQIIITSHHPYIINRIPMKNWYVVHRKANRVSMKSGTELIKKYGDSKQEAFIKLINDPFYKEGIE